MRGLIRLVLVGLVLVVCLSLVLVTLALFGTLLGVGVGLVRVPDIDFHQLRWPTPGSAVAWGNLLLLCPVLLLIILICLSLALWRVLRVDTSKNSQRLDAEESRIMQELYRGMSRLEERVESLETILLDRASRSGSGGKTGRGVGDRRTGEG